MYWVYICVISSLNSKAYYIPYYMLVSLGCIHIWGTGMSKHFWEISGRPERNLFVWDMLHEDFVSGGGRNSNITAWDTCLRRTICCLFPSLSWIDHGGVCFWLSQRPWNRILSFSGPALGNLKQNVNWIQSPYRKMITYFRYWYEKLPYLRSQKSWRPRERENVLY